jgi:hypothetical protein
VESSAAGAAPASASETLPPLAWSLQIALRELWPLWCTGSLRSYPTATSSRGTFSASDGDDGASVDRDLDVVKVVIPHAQRRLRLSDDVVLDVSLRSDVAANPGQRVRSGRKGPGVTRPHDASIVGSAGGQVWLQVDGVRGLVPCSTECFDSLPPATTSAATATASATVSALSTATAEGGVVDVPATAEAPVSAPTAGSVPSRADVGDGDTAAATALSEPPAGPEERGGGGASPTNRLRAGSGGAQAPEGATSLSSSPSSKQQQQPREVLHEREPLDIFLREAFAYPWSEGMDLALVQCIEALGTGSSPWQPSAESICKAVYERAPSASATQGQEQAQAGSPAGEEGRPAASGEEKDGTAAAMPSAVPPAAAKTHSPTEQLALRAPAELRARAATLMFLNRKLLDAVALLDMAPPTAGESPAFAACFDASRTALFACVRHALDRSSTGDDREGGVRNTTPSPLWSLAASVPAAAMGVAFCWDGRGCSLRARTIAAVDRHGV